MSVKFPSLPDPSTSDLQQFLSAVKESLELLEGLRGNGDLAALLSKDYSKPDRIGAILLNGWANYGNGYSDASILAYKNGVTMLSGAIVSPSTYASKAFSLGRELAPRSKMRFAVYTSVGGFVPLDIYPVTGDVDLPTSFSGTVFLDGVVFVR